MSYLPSETMRKKVIDRRVFETAYRTLNHIWLISLWLIVWAQGEAVGICVIFQILMLIYEWTRPNMGPKWDSYFYVFMAHSVAVLLWASMPFTFGVGVAIVCQIMAALPMLHCSFSIKARERWVA